MNPSNDEELSNAMAVWMGRGTASRPQHDDLAVLARFGSRGGALLREIKLLHEAYFRSLAWAEVPDTRTMLERATAEFRQSYPDASNEVVGLLEWAYSYANR